MEIEVRLVYWTPYGMRSGEPPAGMCGYVERREVERLLEEAHARGRQQERVVSEPVHFKPDT